MSHPYDILDVPGSAGQLIFTPCPGSKGTSVQALRPKVIQHPAHVGWIERFGA
ncbi:MULTISPECIES: hypothetical protein [Stutzerimonas stutzeri subgroup]|uniref:Phosphatase family protein n=1 Tax=Stutzerimonas stutzeri NF13 TaxID=1212548 RepID=M2UP51_STUST|nr:MULTISPECIES: hypothetical protein [Stutzerimonas stutzeri subgroup]EME00355.1 phosphatase family protein [Stutzerimonas stutzeri NF13]MCQ4290412.1 hypothetical protein [Stutzerimonas stutzeri]WOF79339.1 hypothetical protein P5704_002190 [Pseudomonas sp. FeN3W]